METEEDELVGDAANAANAQNAPAANAAGGNAR